MNFFSCCTYGIYFEVYFSTAPIRFQECAKDLMKCSDKTIQIQFQQHYGYKGSVHDDLNHKKMLYTLRQTMHNWRNKECRGFRLISHQFFSFLPLSSFEAVQLIEL